jgi:hypothetical protein
MSQNGPYPGPPSHPWAGGNEEPYTEPADPWSTQHSPAPEPSMLYSPYGGSAPPVWSVAPAAPRRRNTAIVAVVVVLGLLIVGGLGTAAWLLNRGSRPSAGSGVLPDATTPTAAANVPDPQPSEDARFVKKGECVRNEGTAAAPAMMIVPCASGTYEVLKRVDGRTTGEADAEAKCSKVPAYTKWYFYDSELDSLDFVLCLKER